MKTCKSGQYYCTKDKKCKPIPTGYHVGRGGWLEKDDDSKKKMVMATVTETLTEMGMARMVMEMGVMGLVVMGMVAAMGVAFLKK